MPRTTTQPKEEAFNLRIPADLKAAFMAAAASADRPAAQVIREFMRAYVERGREPAPGYDAWFRRQVLAALEDSQPGMAHRKVMAKARARLKGKPAGSAKRGR